MLRRLPTAVALTLGVVSASTPLVAQSRPGPAPDTPRLLVAVFASPDLASGVQVANAIRTRITNAVPIRQLYVLPWEHIDQYLKTSGYKSDSALGPSDLKELAKLLRADEVVFGTVSKSPAGLKVEARLARATDVSQAQPLLALDVANPADAARPLERAYMDARKQFADEQVCKNAIRDNKLPAAVAAARAGMVKYPNATIARLCLATAFQNMKQSDSALKIIDEIRRLDPKNSFVHRLAYLAYTEKGDPENAVRSLVELLKLEPTNQTLSGQVVQELAKLGKPAVALPIVDDLLSQNPGDPQLIRQKWLLTLAAASSADTGPARNAMLAKAIEAGEAMVRADTNLSDSTYFARQIAAATASAQSSKAVEFASRATQRFPSNAEFWYLRGQNERRAGQLPMALQSFSRVLGIDPKYPNVNVFVAQIHLEMNQPDSAVAVARRAVVAGEDGKVWGGFLLGPTQAAWKVADSTKALADYEKALALAEESDKLSPTVHAKFFSGISSFFVTAEIVQQAQKAKSCPLARRAQDTLLITMTKMPQGGSVEPKTAQTILGYASQYSTSIDQMIKQYCK